ncbi:hypothetical protein CROQUDRAFT_43824 [Cronartium quercuum f. sp. fusiforme G11]|uniref:Uncharacterized protein n=1 Tax=Cronartium quercuum f. sp. fusiforme G11 TaxID=708437 RepID=A0A9P6NJM4_9BASI|nr:hypothetical protein CROQUDRAFT_43824 [Cronartium quercuum f. sp. fusiforme G11]
MPLYLAERPNCKPHGSPLLRNEGINVTGIKTIYAFGDSWMANGQTIGGPAPPPRQTGDDPKAGYRASNGLVWTEYLAKKLHANLKDYAIGGAVTDRHLWPSRVNLSTTTDMVQHVNTYLSQKNVIDPATTLCLISYGINDYSASYIDGTRHLLKAADVILNQIRRLVNSGIRKFVVVSPPKDVLALRRFDARVMTHLDHLKSTGISTAYVEIVSLFDAIERIPGKFGYLNTSSCCPSANTTNGCCKDPDRYLYYLPRHPATYSHKLIEDWIYDSLTGCPK